MRWFAAFALLAWLGIGDAQAVAFVCTSTNAHCDQPQAYNEAKGASAALCAERSAVVGFTLTPQETSFLLQDGGSTVMRYAVGTKCLTATGGTNATYSTNFFYDKAKACPSGEVNPASGQCSLACPGGYQEDPWSPGQCLDQQKCLARNALPGFLNVGNINTSSTNRCVGGCEYKSVGGSVCTTLGGQTTCSADMDFSGNACSPSGPTTKEQAEAEKDKKQECLPAGSGQTMCVKSNGDHCYNASSGKQICWTPGETGSKTDANYFQKRDAGNTAIPPNLNLPNGDSLQQTGTSTTTSTTTTSPGGTVTNTTTTTTNYTTVNGTDAGGDNNGEPSDGSGGEGEGDENSASGGGSCNEPPVTSGDALLGMITTQTWATRCAVEAGNAVGVTGNIEDCASPFSVEGDNANAHKLRAMRKQICPGENPQDNLSEADYLGDGSGEPTADQVMSSVGDEGFDGWDMSGFGYGTTCPALPQVTVFGRTYDLGGDGRNVAACNMAQLLGWFTLLVAGISCLRIVTEA